MDIDKKIKWILIQENQSSNCFLFNQITNLMSLEHTFFNAHTFL